MNDKNIERERYDLRAKKLLEKDYDVFPYEDISYIQAPYLREYEEFLSKIPADSKILEIGAGMGEHTGFLLKRSNNLCATDISSNSVEVIKKKFSSYKSFTAQVADMEQLPFKNNEFDFVCSAGSLSYGNNIKVMNEIYRVLVNGGSFISVDTLNNNLIFRFNRYVHYLKGRRTKNTLKRMPNIKLLEEYKKKFGHIEVKYHGSLTWLFPILKLFLKEKTINRLSIKFDKKFRIRGSAFKFIMKATKL